MDYIARMREKAALLRQKARVRILAVESSCDETAMAVVENGRVMLSSAIASNLAKGFDLDTAVERAKAYISGALGAMLDLGRGSGPMNHMFDLKSIYCTEKAD